MDFSGTDGAIFLGHFYSRMRPQNPGAWILFAQRVVLTEWLEHNGFHCRSNRVSDCISAPTYHAIFSRFTKFLSCLLICAVTYTETRISCHIL